MAKKILLVDDEPDLLTLVTHGLKSRGYEVISARDGRDALVLAPKVIPDVIILDVHLPVMNGDEVALMLKKDERLKHTPVFLISSVVEGLSERARACSADAWFIKPFELDELDGVIKQHIKPNLPPEDV